MAKRAQHRLYLEGVRDVGTGIDRTLSADWPYPRLVAHRCGGTLAPENTLAGFDACIALRLPHGRIRRQALRRQPALPAARRHARSHDQRPWPCRRAYVGSNWQSSTPAPGATPQFAGERLPTLADAAARCKRDGIAANIEIKPCPGRDDITGQLVARARSRSGKDADATAAAVVVFVRGACRCARSRAPRCRAACCSKRCPTTGCASCVNSTACRCMRAIGI